MLHPVEKHFPHFLLLPWLNHANLRLQIKYLSMFCQKEDWAMVSMGLLAITRADNFKVNSDKSYWLDASSALMSTIFDSSLLKKSLLNTKSCSQDLGYQFLVSAQTIDCISTLCLHKHSVFAFRFHSGFLLSRGESLGTGPCPRDWWPKVNKHIKVHLFCWLGTSSMRSTQVLMSDTNGAMRYRPSATAQTGQEKQWKQWLAEIIVFVGNRNTKLNFSLKQ